MLLNRGSTVISRAEIFSGEVLAIYLSDELGLERLRDFATIHTCSLTLSVTVNFFLLHVHKPEDFEKVWWVPIFV